MKEREIVLNDAWLRIKAPRALIDCADECAELLDVPLAGFVRSAVHAALKAQGMRPPPLPATRRARNIRSLRRMHEVA
jgi:hypothetical protein